jgi:VWFA-related protein
VAVFLAAILLGPGNILTEPPPQVRPESPGRPATPRRSGDDGGFSILLTKPNDPYLFGRQAIAIDPTIPPGDSIAQVDFFVDGRLVSTERKPPYASVVDFGEEIKRHTIVVTALTGGGRRAKVSFVSRSARLAEDSAGPVVIVPAVVRDAAGRPVEGLSVSDFTVLENGVRRPILHFDSEPAPLSLTVAIHAPAGDQARGAFLRAAASLGDSLPPYDAIAFLDADGDGAAVRPQEKDVSARPPIDLTYDRARLTRRLVDAAGLGGGGGLPLADALAQAGGALAARPGDRAILVLVAARSAAEALPPEMAAERPPADPALDAALESLRKADVALHAVVAGDGDGHPFEALRRTAEETGGEFLAVASPDAIDAALAQVAEALLRRYRLSYDPVVSEGSGWRTIEVRLRRPELSVRARRGHFSE